MGGLVNWGDVSWHIGKEKKRKRKTHLSPRRQLPAPHLVHLPLHLLPGLKSRHLLLLLLHARHPLSLGVPPRLLLGPLDVLGIHLISQRLQLQTGLLGLLQSNGGDGRGAIGVHLQLHVAGRADVAFALIGEQAVRGVARRGVLFLLQFGQMGCAEGLDGVVEGVAGGLGVCGRVSLRAAVAAAVLREGEAVLE